MRRLVLLVSALALLPATPALAAKTGEGLAGELTDKVITAFSLGLVLFFALFVTLASVAQHKLDARKDARKAARARQRVGW